MRIVNSCFIRYCGLKGEGISTDFAPVLYVTVVVIDVFMGSPQNGQTPLKKNQIDFWLV